MSQSPAVPVLDLSGFADPVRQDAFIADLSRVARDVGCFYLTGHGISPDLVAEVDAKSRRFFALPEEDKLAVEMVHSPHFRGYTRAAAEYTRGAPDWREQLDIGSERSVLSAGDGAPPWARLQGPNQWPAALPDLRETLLAWQAAQTQVAIRLLRAFAVVLEQPEDVFEPLYADQPNQHLKIIRYPGRHETDSDQGCGPHKDSGIITLVTQLDAGGLQALVDGEWVDAPPLPGTFFVNIGEQLELASNGYLRATIHQVVTPPAGTDRRSSAFFLGARLDATIPLVDLPPHLSALARGPASDPLNPLFFEVGRNYLKSRLRSHPDVARRHHADLLEAAGA